MMPCLNTLQKNQSVTVTLVDHAYLTYLIVVVNSALKYIMIGFDVILM